MPFSFLSCKDRSLQHNAEMCGRSNIKNEPYCTDIFEAIEIDLIQNVIEVYFYIDIYCDIASTTSQEMIIWTRTKR